MNIDELIGAIYESGFDDETEDELLELVENAETESDLRDVVDCIVEASNGNPGLFTEMRGKIANLPHRIPKSPKVPKVKNPGAMHQKIQSLMSKLHGSLLKSKDAAKKHMGPVRILSYVVISVLSVVGVFKIFDREIEISKLKSRAIRLERQAQKIKEDADKGIINEINAAREAAKLEKEAEDLLKQVSKAIDEQYDSLPGVLKAEPINSMLPRDYRKPEYYADESVDEKLRIYESAENGEIDEYEKEELLAMLENGYDDDDDYDYDDDDDYDYDDDDDYDY